MQYMHICTCIHLLSAFPPTCLISISVFGISGMMGTTGCIGRAGRISGWTDCSIFSSREWVHLQVFDTLRGHLGAEFGAIFVVLGGVLATLGAAGVPK